MAEQALTAVIQEACIHGVSTRAIDDLVKAMGGSRISQSRASRLCAEIEERVVAACDDVLAYMEFPHPHWAQIHSTNPLERLNREIKRRSDVIGIFPNDDAIIRLVGALMLAQDDEWTVQSR